MNEKVIKAITLGLAAFMALQSPMAVLAAEGEGNPAADPGNTPNPASQENTKPVDIEGGVADTAQKAADEADTAIGDSQVLTANPGNTNPTPAPASEPGNTDPASAPAGTPASAPAGSEGSGDGSETTATPEPVAESVLDVLNAGAATVAEVNQEGTTAKIKPQIEKDVEAAAQALKKTVEGTGNVPGTVKTADDAVDNIKQELITAENAVVASNNAAQDYVDNFVAASNAANNADAEVSGALQKADEYIKTINNASSIPEANKAKDDLDKLVKDVTADLALQQQAFDEFSGKLDTARTELLDAEDRFNKAIGGATADVTAAKTALETTETKVNALETQVNSAVDNITKWNQAAFNIMLKLDAVKGDGWDVTDGSDGWDPENKSNDCWKIQRQLFTAILQNNANNIIDENAKNIKIEAFNSGDKTVKGDGGKYHYFKVTYKVNGEDHVKYFNYDRADIEDYAEGKNGTGKNIIIYEKTQKEIDAVEYLKKYLADAKVTNGGKAVTYDAAKHTVFSYTVKDENGKDVTKYAVKEQLIAITDEEGNVSYYVKNGDGTESIKVDVKAVPTEAEFEALEVGGTTTSTVITDNSEQTSYYLNEEGQLVKQVKGDYVTTTYTKKQTDARADYKAVQYDLSEEQKDALINEFKDEFSGTDTNGQQVKLEFAEIVTKEGTFYQLTGSYVPIFGITVNKGDIDEWADDNDGSEVRFDIEYTTKKIPLIGNIQIPTGVSVPALTNDEEEKCENGLKQFLQKLEEAGLTVTTKSLDAERIDDGCNYGYEEILIWGTVNFTNNSIIAKNVTGEGTSPEAAEQAMKDLIAAEIDNYGTVDPVTVKTVTGIGEAISMHIDFPEAVNEWLGIPDVDIPYWYEAWKAQWSDQSFTPTAVGYDLKSTSDVSEKTKYSYAINYLESVVTASEEGAILSETTYENAAQALEVIQNSMSKKNGGTGYLDVANDPAFNKLIEDARSLLNQYREYQKQVGEAKAAIDNAQDKVDALEGAINDLGTVATVDDKTIVTSSVGRLTLGAALGNIKGLDKKDWAKYLGLNTEKEPVVSDDGIIVSDLGETAEIPYEELLGMPVGDTDLTFGSLLELPVRDALDILDGLLANEKDKIEAASNKLEELQEKQLKAGEDLAKTIDRLTPKPSDDDEGTPGTPGQPGDQGSDNGGSTPGSPAAPGTRNRAADAGDGTDGVLGARNGGRTGRGGRNAGAGDGELTTIGDGKTALAGSIKDAKANKADSETQKYDKVNIEDQDTPLADFEVEGVEKGSWMWWILALLAGAVTLEEYIRRKRNNAAQASASAESDSKTTD